MNRTRPLFLVCFLLLSPLFAFNSYADVVTIEIYGGTYTGEVSDGVPNGEGTWTLPDGKNFVGNWKDGVPHGHGTYTFPDGRKYVGEYRGGKLNGQGTYIHHDGRKYVGEFKDGRYHGQGTYTFPDGGKTVGEWKDSKPWQATEYHPNGMIFFYFVEGVKVSPAQKRKQEEEAKRLAEEKRKQEEEAKRLAEEKRKQEEKAKRLAEERRKNLDTLLSTKKCVSCDLSGSDLTNSDLTGADLRKANLIDANLSRADLSGANLTGADLSFATLTNANLTGANLTDIRINASAIATNKILPKMVEEQERLAQEREAKRKKQEQEAKRKEQERLAEKKRKKQEQEAKRKEQEKKRLAQEREEKKRIAKEKRKLELEKIALNPGFKDLKPGLTREEIQQMKVCSPELSPYNSSTCYDIDNIKFAGLFSGKFLTVLTIDLGPYAGGGFVQGLNEMFDDDPLLNMRKTLGEKYEMDYDYSERDRQLFNEREKEILYTVYAKGQVALVLIRETKDYSIGIRSYVEYRDKETAKTFLEENRPKKVKSSDF